MSFVNYFTTFCRKIINMCVINIMSKRIKELRIEQNLKQSELGALLNTTQDSVSLWELNKSLPDIPMLIKLCKLFNVSADYLLNLD